MRVGRVCNGPVKNSRTSQVGSREAALRHVDVPRNSKTLIYLTEAGIVLFSGSASQIHQTLKEVSREYKRGAASSGCLQDAR